MSDEGAITTIDDIEEKKALFLVVEGGSKGEKFEIPEGGCRAVGRSLEEAEATHHTPTGGMVSLDDFSKKLVFSYVAKQFGKKEGGAPAPGSAGSAFAGFRREPDFVLADKAISRLHAMFFFEGARVGVLDLVSKNGTYVNGIEVESKVLKEGDLVTVGTTKIRFEGLA